MSNTTRYPEDTDTEMYFPSSLYSIGEAIELAQKKWGDNVDLNQINVSSQKIQIDHFGYDLYDGGDWMNYIILTH